jgi:hypothetical protein
MRKPCAFGAETLKVLKPGRLGVTNLTQVMKSDVPSTAIPKATDERSAAKGVLSFGFEDFQ